MLAALQRHVDTRATWRAPAGGFCVWLALDKGADTAELLPKAIEAAVAYVPGASFFHDRANTNQLRLSVSAVEMDRIDEGLQRLASVLGQQRSPCMS